LNDEVLAPFTAELDPPVNPVTLRPFTLADFLLLELLPAPACSLLAEPGVDDIVHCHLPLVFM
jgi:hypothetical protein